MAVLDEVCSEGMKVARVLYYFIMFRRLRRMGRREEDALQYFLGKLTGCGRFHRVVYRKSFRSGLIYYILG